MRRLVTRAGTGIKRVAVPLLALLCLVASQIATMGAAVTVPAADAASPAIASVSFSNAFPPTVTVAGSGFGSTAPAPFGTQPNGAYFCGSPTGSNYPYLQYGFVDSTVPWIAGQADPSGGTVANCIGISFTGYSDSQVAFTFGSAYGSNNWILNAGDTFIVYVAGLACSATVTFSGPTTCAPPTVINTISFGGSAASPSITVNGSGFGTLPAPTVISPAGFTGEDYACGAVVIDYSGIDGGEAGPASSSYTCATGGAQHYDYLGLNIDSETGYSDSQVQFILGSYYTPGALSAGTPFSLTIAGATCSGTVSYTGAVYCQNSTWGAAQLLDLSSGSAQMSQSIYGAVHERWYKFLVTPGSSLHIQYTGLPGAVLSLHSDLQSEYNTLTNPQNAALESAENASSGFLPQSFLPQSFLPQSFLPQSFLPQSFLPQSFLPQSFLPQSFLPQSFLPQSFLPQSFLPQSFLPGAYSDTPYAGLLAVSATANSAVQTIDHNTWNSFGYMYVRVAAPASMTTPFTVSVTEAGGICAGITPLPFTPPAAATLPTGLTTLILWDSTRIAGSAADISSLGTKLGQFATRPEVKAAVVDLSQIPGIDGAGSAEQQADSNPACPTAKNVVANDIKSVVLAYRAQNPGLQYVVLVGDDRSIPFFRYPDESGLGPEDQYYPPVADSSASNASLRDNYVLGQDEYGTSVDLPLSDLSLPLPGLAVGRLVKTAAEVSHTLDVYTAANGIITPASSLVTGYDFVADAATVAQSELQAGTNVAPDTLISAQGQSPSTSWTANDLRQQLLGSRHDVVFLAGHFSAGGLEAADYATSLSAAEVLSSTVDMSNTLILALGCHGGYDIPVGDAIPNLSPSPDWTEALAEKGATLLSSTGYAYGDTVLTEYGEHLFDNYLRQLRSYTGAGYVPVTTGQAEVAAKQEYLATHTNLTGVDEKTLLETTLYGLPMLQVNMTGQHIGPQADTSIVASAPAVPSGPGQQFGLAVGQSASSSPDIDVQPTLVSHTVVLTNSQTNAPVSATYLTGPNNADVARPGEPILPSQLFDVHVPNEILRGVGFRGGTYADTPHVTPLTSAPGTETSVGHPAFYTSVLYPTQVWGSNFFSAIGGGSEHLSTTPAQYVSTGPGTTDGTLRQFSDLKFRLFYLPSNWTTTPAISQAAEAAAPVIGSVSATADSVGNVTFDVQVLSDQLAGTQTVWVTYTDPSNPGTWQSIDLSQSSTDPTMWTATQNLPGSIVFMVQAASGTGLVTLSTNSGADYTIGTPPSVTTPTTLTLQSAPSSGAYQSTSGSFQVLLQTAGSGGPAPLSGQLVTLQLGSQQALGTTDSAGHASFTVPLNQAPGSYTVAATFAGATVQGTTYLASSTSGGTFTVTPAATTLVLAPAGSASADYSDLTPFTATLADNTGTGLVQRTVVFTVTGNGLTFTKTAITDYLGRAELGAVLLPTGTYSVAAAFGGADHPVQIVAGGSTVTEADPNYLTSSAAPASLTITPEEATVAYSGDTFAAVGATVNFTATVTRADDAFLNDLSLAQVQFMAADSTGHAITTTTAPVAGSGVAVATFPGIFAGGVYTISTTVVGSYFTSPVVTSPLTVTTPTMLALQAPPSGASADYSDTAPITATLTSSNGGPLAQQTVAFTVTGSGLTYTTTASTDSLGRAALGPVPLQVGTYSVAAGFAGSASYVPSSASPISLTITPEESLAAYSGDTFDLADSTIHLAAIVTRADDPALNDLARAQVQFAVVDSGGHVVTSTIAPVAATGLATATLPGTLVAGTYAISTTVVGAYFTSPATTSLLAIYNPSAGYVAGAGFITSPPGACLLSTCPGGGKASTAVFALAAAYQKGAHVPSGGTTFALVGLAFSSTSCQWLVVAGNRAQFEGTGTINGRGNYGFLVTASDGHMPGLLKPGADAIRLQIWDNNNHGAIVYDNQMGQSELGSAATPLGGGAIVIHAS